MLKIRDLLHADRVFRLMGAGLTFKEAARLDDESAGYLLEAWDIACEGESEMEFVFFGPPHEL